MISVICPAKLNLGLRVVRQRPDGYHDLEGLMVALPWFDRLDIDIDFQPAGRTSPIVALSVTGEPDISDDEAPRGEDNIVVRAARMYLDETGLGKFPGMPDISIHLRKTIPAGTGLGGASSDAAGTLLALNDLMVANGFDALDSGSIRSIAARLGSDTVFFLDPRPSTIVGRGEDFAVTEGPITLPVVVAVPNQRLSTAEVFASWDARRKSAGTLRNALTVRGDSAITPCLSVSSPTIGGRVWSPEIFENDLSDAVFDLCPRSADLARLLTGAGARLAAVTGSGAAVYGVCDDMGSARQCASAMTRVIEPGEIVRAFQVGTVF